MRFVFYANSTAGDRELNVYFSRAGALENNEVIRK
jgi:hypothetical protein